MFEEINYISWRCGIATRAKPSNPQCYNVPMQKPLDTLSDALTLPEDQRLTLAHRLLSSLEPQEAEEVEAAWDAEIRRRIRAYDEERAQSISASQVFQEVDERLAK